MSTGTKEEEQQQQPQEEVPKPNDESSELDVERAKALLKVFLHQQEHCEQIRKLIEVHTRVVDVLEGLAKRISDLESGGIQHTIVIATERHDDPKIRVNADLKKS